MKRYLGKIVFCGLVFFIAYLFSFCEKEKAVFFPPELGELKVTDITDSSAMASCSVVKADGIDIIECGFCYYPEEDSSTIHNIKANIQDFFSICIWGLLPEKEYMVKAYAKNVVGVAYSNIISFKTLHNTDTIPSGNDNDTILTNDTIPLGDLPTVQTFDATNVGTTSATLNGYVWATDNNQITATGFMYGTNANSLTQRISAGIGAGSLSETITGLTVNTTYYYKAYATNNAGTGYGDVKQFTTTSSSVQIPSVTTLAATNITNNSATLNGSVTYSGSATITARGFVYGTSSGNLSNTIQSGSGTGTFGKTITGLSSGTTYYYKTYATYSEGTRYGEVKSFTTTTNVLIPSVSTLSAINITTNSATLTGNITSDGGATVTSRGFVYGTSSNNLSQTVQSGSGTGNFSKILTGLPYGTTYYYKAYATNSMGTAYGNVMSFATERVYSPTVITESATRITTNNATLNGNITSDGGATVTSRGFVYGTSNDNLSNNVQCGSGTSNYSKNLTGLDMGTTYYYKAYAANSAEIGYGELKSFTTEAVYVPTVTTESATIITTNSATLNGNVISDGGSTVTARGFLYGTDTTGFMQSVQSGSGIGNYSKNISGLILGATYYFKSYATNSYGTSYGEILQFTTEYTSYSEPSGYMNGYGYVDLGLPNGTKWATYNIGATRPDEYGDYYAWGQTNINNELLYDGTQPNLPPEADAATINWGSGWRMPTYDEICELRSNCTRTWTTINGINGVLFVGPNGKSIFLPAGGSIMNNNNNYLGSHGSYWSSSRSSTNNYAWYLNFFSGGCTCNATYSYIRKTIRPVCASR